MSGLDGLRRLRSGAGPEAGPRPPRGAHGPTLLVMTLVAGLLLGALAVDVLAGPPPRVRLQPVPQGPATSGTWYCPGVAAKDERASLTIAAVGDEPSRITVQRYAGDQPTTGDAQVVQPGASVVVGLDGEAARAPSSVSWNGGPATVTWRVDGKRTTAAPCEQSPSEHWYIPGFDTTLGSTAQLFLFNPFPGDAVVRVTYGRPDGAKTLTLTDNVLIPGNRTTTLDIKKFQPVQRDLAVIVEVLVGRVVAQGHVVINPPPRQRGTPGRLLLTGAREPALSWSFAEAREGEGLSSYLEVLNPGVRAAAVEVRVSDPLGKGSALLGEVNAPAGAVTRIDLADASKSERFGVSLEVVNQAPVVVTKFTEVRNDEGSAVTASLGASRLSTQWSLTGGGTRNRDAVISVYNPGAEPATVDIAAPGAPGGWSAVNLPPNRRIQVVLSDAAQDRPSVPVRVTSDMPVVAELRSVTGDDPERVWTATGVLREAWLGPPTRPAVELDPGLPTYRDAPVTEAPLIDDVPVDATELPTVPAPGDATEPAPAGEGQVG